MAEIDREEQSKLSYEKDLLERPAFNFRFQIILGFFTFFILSVAITIAAMVTINGIEKRIATVQVWERFLFNIEQARRWEKNFFLYGTNLSDALQSADDARELLERHLKDLKIASSPTKKQQIIEEMELYYSELHDLSELVDQTRRIAKGDFTPVKPVRKYRDEFTTVEVAINRMLRELERRQNSLIESHKLRAVGILTAGVAHELNNPLNNIMLTAYSLLEEYGTLDRNEHMDMIQDIIGETERSRSIVHNLLDFTRENVSVLELLDLGKLVQETAKLALNQARVRGAAINVEVEPDLPRIQGDRQQLKQVVLNLILNSLDAVSSGGRIEVDSVPGRKTVFTITLPCDASAIVSREDS